MLSQIRSTADAKALQLVVPRLRFQPYTKAASGSLLDAARLYILDAELRGSVLERIHFVEVAMRDAFHRTLSSAYGEHWFRGKRVILDDRTRSRFREAEARLSGSAVTPARVIAEISLGGWGELLEVGATSEGGANALAGRADYERDLWSGHLETLFASEQLSRQSAAALVRRVRRLRNRVAHHESVVFGIHQPGEQDASGNQKRQSTVSAIDDVATLATLFCNDAADWLATCTHVEEHLAAPLAVAGHAHVRENRPNTYWI
ncbi:hypothetical protein ACIQTT_07515 [Microbacterium sp. NPDC090225]|uniref:hypothetical protein n=1 Tax=Microbacterium sp. NPDC090225 TaxID=3364207 RepID=UPI003802A3FA